MAIDNIYAGWIGRNEVRRERVDAHRAQALAATLDVLFDFVDGAPLPPGWQWLYFNPIAARSTLAEDGHPRRELAGSFLPPVPLPRRMWAGSRVRYLRELPIGVDATRESHVVKIVEKDGRGGKLCFVTVEHRISAGSDECIVEEQDIVYREASARLQFASVGLEPAPDAPVEFSDRITPDSTLLFRYSALTFNGHRIHYDKPYARDFEGYRNLVVHGPLTATLLQNFARACKPECALTRFDFKGVNPLFVEETFELQAWSDANDSNLLNMRALDARGVLAMQASAYCKPIY
nr:MaoC family dehydratase N-terminal domain-containing protein [Burkholderia sp. L27(2015)]